jgi:hypothetical protein
MASCASCGLSGGLKALILQPGITLHRAMEVIILLQT